jgi:hypothetical protein
MLDELYSFVYPIAHQLFNIDAGTLNLSQINHIWFGIDLLGKTGT